jgi:hypothetical protein
VLAHYPSERKEVFERNFPDIVVGRGYTRVWESMQGRLNPEPALEAGDGFERAWVSIPWLAFCSGPYLKQHGRRLDLPRFDQSTFAVHYTDETTSFDDELGLPRTIDFYTPTRQPVCRYRAVGTTNIVGWTFPLSFELAQYRQNFHTSAWDLLLTASGKIASLSARAQPQLPTESQRTLER